jgi:CheY-like chemotaxis protein
VRTRILVVDDQPAILITYTLILQQQGYLVTSAASYEQAVQDVRDEPFDLLLCDFSLNGGHSGLEVIDLARSQQGDIGSLLLTGYPSPEIAEQATRRGATVLSKPTEIPELLRELEKLAAAHWPRSQATPSQPPVVREPKPVTAG